MEVSGAAPTPGAPLVSVIIPAFNCRDLIGHAIRSVVYQTHADWELIVVDDGSTDGTAEVAAAHLAGHPRTKLVRTANGGASAARNRGFRESDPAARYLFFLDADDRLRPPALARLAAYLEGHPEVGLVGCQFDYIDYDSERIIPARRTRICRRGLLPRDLRDDEPETPFAVFFACTGQGPFALYRRSVFERTRGWSEDFWGHVDSDMFIQMALEAPVHYLPDKLYLKKKVRTSLKHRPGRDELLDRLRAKWDHYETGDPARQAMIAEARHYYYTLHEPLREMKVAWAALRHFSREPSWQMARWTARLLASGLGKLAKYQLLRRPYAPPPPRPTGVAALRPPEP